MVLGRALLGAGLLAIRAGAALRRVAPPAAVAAVARRFIGRAGAVATKAPPRVATKPAIRGLPKLIKPVVSAPRRVGRLARGAAGAAAAGALFFAGEQVGRKLFKGPTPSPTSGTGTLPRDGGVPIAAGAAVGALLPTVGRVALAKGRVGAGMGLLSGAAGLARKGAVPALAGAGVVAIGGRVVDSVSGQPVGFRRVKRSRIGFKRSDLKAFRRVISTAKRVKKILTKAGIGTFKSSRRGPTHSELESQHRRLK